MDEMKQAIDYMVKVIEQSGDQVIEQKAKQFSKQIKTLAQIYLDTIKPGLQNYKNVQQSLRRQQYAIRGIKQGSIQDSYEYRTQVQNRALMTRKDYYRQMVEASLRFQRELNELLGQVVQLVYVYQDDKGNPTMYTLKEQDLMKVLSYERNKKAIKGRFRETDLFKTYLKNKTKYDIADNFNLDYFNWTYKEVIWRFNYGKKTHTSLILWLNNPSLSKIPKVKWLKAKVDKSGDIKQAYASVLLDRSINSVKLFNSQKLDDNVHMYMEELAKVDSESGLLKGDVEIGQIEYAIKGFDAQTLGMNQIIKLAEQIVGKEVYTERDLKEQKQYFHKIAGTRNKIEEMTQDMLNKQLGDLIQAKNRIGMNELVKYYAPKSIF